MSRVVVVGAGIAGLTAAFSMGDATSVTVLERSERVGGKVRTEPFAGIKLDVGPDSFLARVPAAVELCRAVGLGDDLVSPSTGIAYLWSRGKLRRLPGGLVLGAPTDLVALARSQVLSPAGTLRAALDLILPARRASAKGDIAVADLTRARFGSEAHARLIDPLLGGINAGRSEDLSLAVAAPRLDSASRSRHRSLIRALRAESRESLGSLDAHAAPGPVFLSVRGGMERLTSALGVAVAKREGGEVRLRTEVASITPAEVVPGSGRWTVVTTDGATLAADAVVVAVPAPQAAGLLADVSPQAARLLGAITYSSVALVTLAYRAEDVGHPLEGSGFLVPRVEGRLMTACSWPGSKWTELATPGQVIFRVSAGRAGDDRALQLDDGQLVDRLHSEMVEAMGVRARPIEARVHRWIDAFPQFAPGHLERVRAIESALATEAPGVAVVGAAYRGVGLATCIVGAQAAVPLCSGR